MGFGLYVSMYSYFGGGSMIASPGDHEPHPDEPHLEELHPSTVRHLFPLQTPNDSEELQGRLS